jgi:hypothetical protein
MAKEGFEGRGYKQSCSWGYQMLKKRMTDKFIFDWQHVIPRAQDYLPR